MAPLTRRQKKSLAAARPPPVIDPADRISNLPDEIQAQILSFLPAQEAVRTCVLARTWRNREVWKLTRCLLITGDHKSPWEWAELKQVRGFVDRLLRLRGDAPIDACKIEFNWGDDGHETGVNNSDTDDIEIMHAVESWIRRVLECPVQSLRVHMFRDVGNLSDIAMSNLGVILVSQHLTRLELCCLRFFNGDGMVIFTDTGCLNFSGCPALEHLELTSCDLRGLEKVTSPWVKRLVIANCYTHEICAYCLEICFPGLLEGFFWQHSRAVEHATVGGGICLH